MVGAVGALMKTNMFGRTEARKKKWPLVVYIEKRGL